MDRNFTFCLFIFFASFALTLARVPFRRGSIQHPPVLTRPATQPFARSTGGKNYGNKRNKQTATSEPPEVDDDLLTTTGQYREFGYIGSTVTPFYDFATYTATGPTSGGTSWEYDDDYVTTQRTTSFKHRQNSRRGRFGPSYRVHTTSKPTTTTTEEPPEQEVETPIGKALFGAHSGLGASGYCFCSPLKSCPSQSVARGGSCMNFISFFTRIRFIRCCYSPSWAKRHL